MIILEENFKWHLEAFASELFIYNTIENQWIKKKENLSSFTHNKVFANMYDFSFCILTQKRICMGLSIE